MGVLSERGVATGFGWDMGEEIGKMGGREGNCNTHSCTCYKRKSEKFDYNSGIKTEESVCVGR